MRFAASVAVLVAAAGIAALRPDSTTNGIDRASIVALVDGQPILVRDIQALLRPKVPRVGVEPAPNPIRQALARAIDNKLFALEGGRQGLQVSARNPSIIEAVLAQKYMANALNGKLLDASAVSEWQAKAFYQRHPWFFDRIEHVYLSAIVVAERPLALDVLHKAQDTDRTGFARLARRYSKEKDPRSGVGGFAVVDGDGHGASAGIARAALWMRKQGRIGLALDLDGNYVVLRADRVESVRRPWGPNLFTRVRNVIAYRANQKAKSELASKLRRNAAITIHHDALRDIKVPTWAEYTRLY